MKKISLILVSVCLIVSLSSCGGSDEKAEETSGHLYDRAVVENLISGSGDKLDTQYAYIEAESSEADLNALADVYFNFYKDSDLNYLIIAYTDDEPYGVYMMGPLVEDRVKIEKKSQGQYMMTDDSDCDIYSPQDDGTLALFE